MAVGRVVKVAAMVAAMPPVMARAVKVALAVRPMLPVRRAARVAALVASVNFADVCITSDLAIETGEGPDGAFRLDDVAGVAVVHRMAAGQKCARSWRFSTEIGADPDYPDVTPRDAAALREWDRLAAQV